ncbi:ferric reductase-like transmembrane domain-containing protein [Candidatus Saccharibacteria bacterium]|nr:ferric reductase-like transmembrane domain-containing protein [Candidatus Saccharibacteria bacterium]
MSEQSKRNALVWLMALTMLPLPYIVALPNMAMASSFWLYVSAVTGYLGLVMLMWMFILGTRSVMGLFFNDLAPVLSIHKWLGKYGTLLVFAHPVAIALSYGVNMLTYTLVPALDDGSFERTVTWGRFALWALIIIWITSALVRDRIAFRPWKYIHYLAYVALPLALLHIPAIGSSYRSLDAPRAYFMSVLALFFIFAFLRIRHLFGLGKARYVVTKHLEISPDVWMVAMRPEGRAISLRRGQYIYLQWSLLGESHPFTVLQHNTETGELTVAYKTAGAWTRKMTQLADGDELYVDGPYGDFMTDIDEASEPRVYIAAGIGITPFVDQLLTQQSENSWLFYANQRPESATFSRQLQSRLGDHYISILSRVETPAGLNDERGRIRADIMQKYLREPGMYHYYICGSEGFMERAEEVLHEVGVPHANIHAEAFGW